MAVATFDTLKAAGMPAEAQAVAFAEVLQINFRELLTKADLDQGVKDIRGEMTDIRREMTDLKTELKREIKDSEQKLSLQYARVTGELLLLKWMLGATLTAVVGLVVRLFFFKIQ